MNFRDSQLFSSLATLAVALFFFILGLLALLLPWSPSAQTQLILLILEHSSTLALFGLGFVLMGLSLILYIAFRARHQYYTLRGKERSIKIDQVILQSYLDSYWKQLYPRSEIAHRLTLKGNRIYISAALPYTPPAEQKPLLIEMKESFVWSEGMPEWQKVEEVRGLHTHLQLGS